MRWDVTKAAWTLAKNHFSKVGRLFVSLPHRFAGEGACPVYDLDAPELPIGHIQYRLLTGQDDKPIISMHLDDKTSEAPMERKASISFEAPCAFAKVHDDQSINAADVSTKYSTESLGEQMAYLILGHEDGLGLAEPRREVSAAEIEAWIAKTGFPCETVPFATSKLASLGIKIAAKNKKDKRKFEQSSKVRVVDPISSQYNECGSVMSFKMDRDDDLEWYLVRVDGSSEPAWYREWQLAADMAGKTPNE